MAASTTRIRRLIADEVGDCYDEDVSESAVSHALSDLVEAGLATRRTERNWRYYETTDVVETLLETAHQKLTENE